jgi:hypothetical protein
MKTGKTIKITQFFTSKDISDSADLFDDEVEDFCAAYEDTLTTALQNAHPDAYVDVTACVGKGCDRLECEGVDYDTLKATLKQLYEDCGFEAYERMMR